MKVIYIKSQRPLRTKAELYQRLNEAEEEAYFWSEQAAYYQNQLAAIYELAVDCIPRPRASEAQQ